MSLTISPDSDSNYHAVVVVCPEPKPHPKADRLEILTIFGNDTIVAKGCYLPGEKLVYFPVESCIANKYLAWASLYTNPALNRDHEKKGYFESKGRVRAVKLRDVPSQGFLVNIGDIALCYGISTDEFKLGLYFDTIGEEVICTKYTKGTPGKQGPRLVPTHNRNWLDKAIGVMPKPIRVPLYHALNSVRYRNTKEILDGHFKFHYKTEHLGRNMYQLGYDDPITITSKLHGTSAIFGKVLCKNKGWLSKFKKQKTKYEFIYSSRSVIKNVKHTGFTDDVWGQVAKEIHEKIPDGYTVYGEIVGYTPTGRLIQKNYDYGVSYGHHEFYVYRITQEIDKEIYELEWNNIEKFCKERNLKTVPVYFSGYADALFPYIPHGILWHDTFLGEMRKKFLDKTCEFCTTGVINEGVVLRIECGDYTSAFKFKSPKFNVEESSLRDSDYEDMEELN